MNPEESNQPIRDEAAPQESDPEWEALRPQPKRRLIGFAIIYLIGFPISVILILLAMYWLAG